MDAHALLLRYRGRASYAGISMSTFAEVSGTPTVVHARAWCVYAHGERVQPRLSLEAGRVCLPLHICPRSKELSLFFSMFRDGARCCIATS